MTLFASHNSSTAPFSVAISDEILPSLQLFKFVRAPDRWYKRGLVGEFLQFHRRRGTVLHTIAGEFKKTKHLVLSSKFTISCKGIYECVTFLFIDMHSIEIILL